LILFNNYLINVVHYHRIVIFRRTRNRLNVRGQEYWHGLLPVSAFMGHRGFRPKDFIDFLCGPADVPRNSHDERQSLVAASIRWKSALFKIVETTLSQKKANEKTLGQKNPQYRWWGSIEWRTRSVEKS